MKRGVLILILSLAHYFPSHAAQPKAITYEIDVTFFPNESRMVGRAEMTLESGGMTSDSILFYLHGELTIDSILDGNHSREFSQGSVFYDYDYSLIATRVAFRREPESSGGFKVFYRGYFSPSKARSPSDYMRIDGSGVYLRAYAYSLWFPVFLEAGEDGYPTDFSSVTIRTSADYVPIFAGERISEDTAQGWRVSRWRAPHLDLFAAQCTAQKFQVEHEAGVYLYHWRDSASIAMNRQILNFVKSIISNYSDRYRKNASTGQVHIMEMPEYGDISSGNVTGITSAIWKGFDKDIWSKRGLAHELVHPYVATGVKMTDSLYALAIEGFASYFHLPIIGELFGNDWYEQSMAQTEAEYLKKRRTGLGWRDRPVPKEKTLTQISASEVGEYKDNFVLDDRALLFLHWLYRRMGREHFQEFTRELFNGDQVSFDSFQRLILKYLPSAEDDIRIWLCTTDFPDRFRISSQ